MKRMIPALLIAGIAAASVLGDTKLEKRVAELEKEMAELKEALAPVLEEARTKEVAEKQRLQARQRMRRDSEVYSRDQLREIEDLYQVANKQWRSQEGKESLEALIKKYDKANRTGCALLYLGRMSEGEDRRKYLKEAIEDYSDCYYGDGVQVGAYARFCLAHVYRDAGDSSKADRLFAEIRTDYPEAIDHSGRLLSTLMPE
jgi:hypothetical protein